MSIEQPQWTPPAPVAPTVAPGWYPDPSGVMRFWDGQQWTQHVPPPQSAYQQPLMVQQQPAYMVTKTRKQTNHVLHLILTILTGGVWGVCVWIPITIYNAMRHDKAKTRIYG